jgi:FkbM family methyltransferase
MKTLVYLGCHEGYSLKRLLNQHNFDKIILVEADPDTFKRLLTYTQDKPNIVAINKCVVSDKNIKSVKFYRTVNDGASNSVLQPKVGESFIKDTIEVETVYLPDLFRQYNINEIDFYISDLQGNDFMVLTTIKDMIDNKQIKELFLETFDEEYGFYEKNDNKIQNYYSLLKNNYKIDYMSADSTLFSTIEQVVKFCMNDGPGELDVHWSLRDQSQVKYFLT